MELDKLSIIQVTDNHYPNLDEKIAFTTYANGA